MKKMDELDEQESKLNFGTIKNKFWEIPNSIKEELKLRKITRKKVNEIEGLETEIKKMKRLEIKTIENKLFNDLNIEKSIEIDEIKKVEIKLEELKMSKK